MDYTLHYRGRPMVTYGAERVYLLPALAVLEDDHPIRRFVTAMCLYLFDVDWGLVPGPPNPGHAAVYARAVLMPEDEFGPLVGMPDALLAEEFNVPLDEVEQRRLDLARYPLDLRH